MIESLKSLGLGVVSFGLIVLVVFGGYNLLALNLGTVTGDYFKGALAVIVLLVSAYLSMQGMGFVGKPFFVAACIVLLSITFRYRVPGVAAYFTQTAKAADRSAEHAAVNLNAARVVPCDRTTPALRFFERETGKPLIWLSETDTGRLICWDRPGHHPQTNKDLVPVDESLAAAILRQEPAVTAPSPAPMVAQLQPPPTPVRGRSEDDLPELGQRAIPK
jgi:hypothetical protein